MALDQDQKPLASISAPTSGIDNEIAAYRAISPAAILSLICGVLAVLCFTSWFFLAFTLAAIVLGLSAERRIRRDPEIWTGRKLAQAGMALGLVFGLAAVTSTLVQDFLRSRGAGQFASQYAEVLKKGRIEDAAFYTVSPPAREGKKPVEIYKELTAQRTARHAQRTACLASKHSGSTDQRAWRRNRLRRNRGAWPRWHESLRLRPLPATRSGKPEIPRERAVRLDLYQGGYDQR